MTILRADDPDAHVILPVTAKTGDLSFDPVVRVRGLSGGIDAEWLGPVGSPRNLKVPLYGLPTDSMLFLSLIVPGDNDLELGYVILEAPTDDGSLAQSTDHGSVAGPLVLRAGTHEFDLAGDVAVTVAGLGDITLFVHGTGQALTVAGQVLTIDGDQIVLIVTSPRGVQTAVLVGEAPVSGGSGGGGSTTITATAPTFTDLPGTGSDTYTIPSQTGVAYRVGLTAKAAGTYPGSGTVEITAVALSGYALTGTTSWSHTFTTATGWGTEAADTFTAADGTALTGRSTPTGGIAYTDVTGAGTIQGGRMTNSDTSSTNFTIPISPAASGGLRASFDYDMTGALSDGNTHIGIALPNMSSHADPQSTQVTLFKNAYFDQGGYEFGGFTAEPGKSLTSFGNTGKLTLEQQGTTIRLYYNDVHVGTGTLAGAALGTKATIKLGYRGVSIDNLLVEAYR